MLAPSVVEQPGQSDRSLGGRSGRSIPDCHNRGAPPVPLAVCLRHLSVTATCARHRRRRVIADLTRHGYRPYLAIERSEDDRWRRMFKNRTPLGALDWPAEVVFDHAAGIRIFDLTKRPPLE